VFVLPFVISCRCLVSQHSRRASRQKYPPARAVVCTKRPLSRTVRSICGCNASIVSKRSLFQHRPLAYLLLLLCINISTISLLALESLNASKHYSTILVILGPGFNFSCSDLRNLSLSVDRIFGFYILFLLVLAFFHVAFNAFSAFAKKSPICFYRLLPYFCGPMLS
jgi:hypothetical protein